MATQTRVLCPCCALSRIESAFNRTDGERYGSWDDTKPIIDIRDMPGGKASKGLVGTGKYRRTPGLGFPIIDSFTLDTAKDMAEYKDYIQQIKDQLLKVTKIFHDQGLISDKEIDAIK